MQNSLVLIGHEMGCGRTDRMQCVKRGCTAVTLYATVVHLNCVIVQLNPLY